MPVTKKQVEQSIAALVRQNKFTFIIYSLIVPVVVGVYCTYYEKIVNIEPSLFWIPVIFFICIAVIFAYLSYEIKLAPELYIEHEAQVDTINDLSESVGYLSAVQESSLAFSSLVVNHLADPQRSADFLLTTSKDICALLCDNRTLLFGTGARELWSFALYFYDRKRDELRPVWRSKSDSHPSKSKGRAWQPGQGHVGIAFAQAEPKICPDASDNDVWAIFAPTTGATKYDRRAYRSFVSHPIGPPSEHEKPYGVLVATSDVPGRFDISSALALRHASAAIASLIRLGYNKDVVGEVCDLQ